MFFDRYDAGHQLAQKLQSYFKTNAVVYAIPPGGVLTGFALAKDLQLPLELVISHKVPHPLNHKCAVCAVTEEGERVCDELGVCGVEYEWIEHQSILEHGKILRERLNYMKDNQVVPAVGKTAIIVSDGIGAGLIMKAAILTIKHQNPAKIVIASAVASTPVVRELRSFVDEVIVLEEEAVRTRPVSSYYTNFPTVFTKDVRTCLERSKVARNKALRNNYHSNLTSV